MSIRAFFNIDAAVCGAVLPGSPGQYNAFIPDILGRFSLFDNGQLNNAAAILFAKGEKTDYFQCMVRLARFRGIDKAEFIDNVQVR